MAEITKEELKKEITAILKDADLTTMSAKKVRQQVEEKLDCDLSSRKKEIDDIVMQCLKTSGKKGGSKKNGKGDDDEDEEEEDEEEEEEEEEEDDEDEKPKRAAKKPPQKRKKDSSEESGSDAEDKEDSEEEYSPSKKNKGKPKGKAAGKGRKKKGSDSDSDEDWGKGKKGSGGKKGGGKRGGGGYTKVCTLSAELAAVVGAEQMARHEVVKKIWSLIKEKNLYDPKNKQFAICNDEFLKVFATVTNILKIFHIEIYSSPRIELRFQCII
ncbi:upstream activation factor subunit spp27 homolog Non2 isoform X1 [Lycorma delicatula]|uniref:upstream activation factor subunit spp27 homolog Non2 isoform X1 n=1 Tax=Lycorma delicatula TaxID=130591 RepID=UPI003F51845A